MFDLFDKLGDFLKKSRPDIILDGSWIECRYLGNPALVKPVYLSLTEQLVFVGRRLGHNESYRRGHSQLGKLS